MSPDAPSHLESPNVLSRRQRYVLGHFDRLTMCYSRALAMPAVGFGAYWSFLLVDRWFESDLGIGPTIRMLIPVVGLGGVALLLGERLDRRLRQAYEDAYITLRERFHRHRAYGETETRITKLGWWLFGLSILGILAADDVPLRWWRFDVSMMLAIATLCLGVALVHRPLFRHWVSLSLASALLALYWVIWPPEAESYQFLLWIPVLFSVGFVLDARESLAMLREVLGPSMSAHDDLDIGTE